MIPTHTDSSTQPHGLAGRTAAGRADVGPWWGPALPWGRGAARGLVSAGGRLGRGAPGSLPGSSLPFSLSCLPALQVRGLQAAGPERPRGRGVEGTALPLPGRDLGGLAGRRGAHQQLRGRCGPQPAAPVPGQRQPGAGQGAWGDAGRPTTGGIFTMPLHCPQLAFLLYNDQPPKPAWAPDVSSHGHAKGEALISGSKRALRPRD